MIRNRIQADGCPAKAGQPICICPAKPIVEWRRRAVNGENRLRAGDGNSGRGPRIGCPEVSAVIIHVVKRGETVYGIARQYGVDPRRLMVDNGVPDTGALAVGQTLTIRFPREVYAVRQGDTLTSIARAFGVTVRQLYRRNVQLGGRERLVPGENLVISYLGESLGAITTNSYAYPYIDRRLLDMSLPYMSCLTPFTYGITAGGNLLPLEDGALLSAAGELGALPLMHLSSMSESGQFDNQRSGLVLTDPQVQRAYLEEVLSVVRRRGYRGVDVDFEFIPAAQGQAYVDFVDTLRRALAPMNYPVLVALAPKTHAQQAGILYEGHDYRGLGAAADFVLLMTYEWGYAFGAPMAVAPLPQVRQVLDYAVTEIPAGKILLGIPNYGYDWPLPFRQGETRGRSLSSQEAVALAVRYGAEIQYDQTAQSPYFFYTAEDGRAHTVWFEDGRSVAAKLRLVAEYGLHGAGYWNLMRPFVQGWTVLDGMYEVADAQV